MNVRPATSSALFRSPVRISRGRLNRLGAAALFVAHETKAMLAVAQVAAHAVEQGGLSHSSGDSSAIRILRSALLRANVLLDQILRYGTERPLQLEPVLCQDVLARVAQVMRLIAEGSGTNIHISEQYPDAVPATWADESLLESALMNLALNGLNALGQEGGSLDFKLSTDYASTLEIRIRNSGPAVSRLRPCQASPPPFARKRRGTGLGLRIARAGIAAHGGCLKLRQDDAQSVVAVVMLPLAPCHLDGAAKAR